MTIFPIDQFFIVIVLIHVLSSVISLGLSARVIRVWFQNKRCKDKKKAIAAASGDDVISSSVADSPSEDRLKSGMVCIVTVRAVLLLDTSSS